MAGKNDAYIWLEVHKHSAKICEWDICQTRYGFVCKMLLMHTISWADTTHEIQCFDALGYNAFYRTWTGNSGKKTIQRGQNQYNCPNSVREMRWERKKKI